MEGCVACNGTRNAWLEPCLVNEPCGGCGKETPLEQCMGWVAVNLGFVGSPERVLQELVEELRIAEARIESLHDCF